MKNVLVTGAAGFIGYKTALYFVNKGYQVCGWDLIDQVFSEGSFEINKINMLDEGDILKALGNLNPEIIIHCAGSADVGKSVQYPEIDYEGNVTITHNLLFAMHKLGLENTRFVFLSSAGVYGNPQKLPIKENASLNPLSPYAVHKVMCEELCKYFASNYGMNIKVARIFSAYGAGLRKQIFWDMYQKYSKTGRLDMFGTGYESRDYIHVDDVIQSLYILANTDSKEVLFNVANGEETTILEATQLFADSVGCNHDCISFNGFVREGDPLNWRADISKIKGLGYKKTTDMKTGLEDYIEWTKKCN